MNTIKLQRASRSFRATSLVLAVLMIAPNGVAFAAPAGGRVVSGSGNISSPSATHTLIEQQTQRLAIDWQSFDVAAGERVQFVQPNSNAVALNRIMDGKASQIFGQIDANGRVILQNTHGILFGRTAMVDTGGLVATSMNVDLAAFARGDAVLVLAEDPQTAGAIVNQGIINAATGGSVALVGAAVANDGLITARLGRVDLAAGSEAVLTFDSDNMIGVRVSKDLLHSIGAAAAVSNSGEIRADGGIVVMSAAAARELFDTAINNSGIVEANGAEDHGGRIFLTGSGTGGDVINTGTLDASGTTGGEIHVETGGNTELHGDAVVRADGAQGSGGSIALLGSNVGLFDNAQVSASGTSGGGTVLIGGDYQGANAAVRNANAVYLDENTVVRADATVGGNGGKLIVWSDESSRAYGELSARGGAQAGNGGFIETSSHGVLDVTRAADVTAANGAGGSWLLDPRNITIVSGNGSSQLGGAGTSASPYSPTGNTSNIGVGVLQSALSGGADVYVQGISGTGTGEGDIIWNSTAILDIDGTGDNGLHLTAADDIIFQGKIVDSLAGGDSLNLFFNAADDILIRGNIFTGDTGTATFVASNATTTATADILSQNGIVFADDASTTVGLFGQLRAGGDVTLTTSGTGSVNILNNPATGEAYGAAGAISSTGAVTINAPKLIASDTTGAGINFEVVGSVINLNVATGAANTTQRLDIAGIPVLGSRTLNALNIDDQGTGDLLLQATYDVLGSTTIKQGAVEGVVDINYDDLAFAGLDGNVKVSSGATQNTVNNATVKGALVYEAGAQTLNTLAGSVLDIGYNSAFRNTLAGGDIDFTQGSVAVQGAILEFDTVQTSAGAKDANVNLTVNGGTLLGIGNGSDIQGNLTVTNTNSGTVIDDTNVAGDLVFGNTGIGNSFQGFAGLNYGGTVNGTTHGGSISLYNAGNVGTLDTSLGGNAGGSIYLLGPVGGNMNIGTLQTKDGFVQAYADGDLNVTLVDTTAAGGTGAGVSLNAGQDDGGSNNTIGDIKAGGTNISLAGGDGDDTFSIPTLNGPVAFGGGGGNDTLNVNARSGAVDSFTFTTSNFAHGDGVVNGNYTLFGDVENLHIAAGDMNDTAFATWSVTPPAYSIVFDGGSGSDSINGPIQSTQWNITGNGSGSINGTGFGYSGSEKLFGGSLGNQFMFFDGGSIAEVHGNGGYDVLDYNNLTSGSVLVTIDQTLPPATNGGTATALDTGFTGIDKVVGRMNGFGSNTLAITGTDNAVWTVDGVDSGKLVGPVISMLDFQMIGSLQGGSGTDNFVLQSPGSLSGGVTGNGGYDTLDLSAAGSTLFVDLGAQTASGIGVFSGLERVVGNDSGSTLYASNSPTVNWSIVATNGGQVEGMDFAGFNFLRGGTGNDVFSLGFSGYADKIDGGAGYNTLDLSSLGVADYVQLTGIGVSGVNGTADGIMFDNLDRIQANSGTISELYAFDTGNASTWTLAAGYGNGALDDGSSLNLDFTGFSKLYGSNADDSFVFQPTAAAMTVDGGGGHNVLDFSGYNENIHVGGIGVSSAVTLSPALEIIGFDQLIADAGQYNTATAPDGFNFDVSIYGTRSAVVDDGSNPFDLVNFDEIATGDGDDTFHLDGGTLTAIHGGSGSNSLIGASGGSSFLLNGGSMGTADGIAFDSIAEIYGQGGNDTLTTSGSTYLALFSGGDGTDTVTLNSNGYVDQILGDDGSDTLNLNGGSTNSFVGGNGSDTINAQAGIDTQFSNLRDTVGDDGLVYDITNLVTVVGSFDEVETLAGNTGNDLFWVTGNFSGALNGGAGDDQFTVFSGASAGAIDGGTATTEDKLIGSSAVDTVRLTAAGSGSLNSTTTFSGIERYDSGAGGDDVLYGTTGIDVFTQVDGDSVTVSAATFAADGIAKVDGNGGVNTLYGTSGDDIFVISGTDGGTLNGMTFVDFSGLNGWAGDDHFNFTGTGSLSSLLVGGSHTVADYVDFSGATVSADVFMSQYSGIESVIGSTLGGDQLHLMAGVDSVTLTGAGTGSTTGSLGTRAFSGFETLIGNGGADTITGSNAGDSWSITGPNSGSVLGTDFTGFANVNGGSGSDSFYFADGSSLSGALDGGSGYDGIYNQNAGTWTMSGAGTGSYNNGTGTAFSGMEWLSANGSNDVIVGTSGADVFDLGNGGLADISGVIDLYDFTTFQGGNGNDRFLLNDDYGYTVSIAAGSGDDSFEATNTSANIGAGSTFDGGTTGETLGDLLLAPDGDDEFHVTGANTVYAGPAGSPVITASNLERLDSGDGTDQLYGSAAGDVWNLADSGSTVAGIAFLNAEKLYAGNGSNTFNIGNYTGSAIGGAGSDLFILNGTLNGAIDGNGGSDELRGTTGNDTVVLNATTTINGAGFANIELLTGNGGSDTIQAGSGIATTFNVTGLDSGNIGGGMNFGGFSHLTGDSAADSFNFTNAGRISSGIDGAGGSDTVTGSASAEAWTVSGIGSGNLANGAGNTALTAMESIVGNGGADTLTLSGGGAQTVTLTGSNSGSTTGFQFSGIGSIDAGLGNDVFSLLSGSYAGTLTGGDGDDELQFNGGALGGTFNGGSTGETSGDRIVGSTGDDTATITGSEAGNFNGGTFADVERIDAAGGSDTLATSGTNTWNLGGGTDQVSGIAFANFDALSAGNGADTFNINGAVALDLNGNGGNDVFNFNSGGTLAGDAFGGDGDDTFNLLGGTLTGTLDGGSTGETLGDLIAGNGAVNSFSVTGSGSGSVDAHAFSGVERLDGGDGNDSFAVADTGSVNSVVGGLGSDTLSVGSSVATTLNGGSIVRGATMNWSGFEDLLLGTSGSAAITVGTPVSVSGNVTLGSAAGIATTGASRIAANAISATASGNVVLYTDTNSIDVSAGSSDVGVNELNGLTSVHLAGANVGLTTGGAVSDSDGLVDVQASTSVTIDVGSGALGSLSNSFYVQSPVVDITTANAAQFLQFSTNVGSLNLDAGSADITLDTSSTAIGVDQGVADSIVAGGLRLLNGNFTLDGSNAVGTLAAATDSALAFNNGSNNLVIGTVGGTAGITTSNDAVDLAGGNIAVNGAIDSGSARTALVAGGGISQTAAITSGALLVRTGSGNAVLTDAGNDFDTLAANVAGNLQIADGDGFVVGTIGATSGVQSTGFTAIDAGGTVTDNSALNVNGLALTGTATYLLDVATNSFGTLAVDTTGGVGLQQAGALTVGTVNGTVGVDTGSSNFGLATSGGNLTLTGNVDAGNVVLNVTDASAIGGIGTITAGNLNVHAGGNIVVDTDIDTLTADSSSGSLTVTENDVLTVSSASAATTLSIDAGDDITLDAVDAANVTLTSGGALIDNNGNSINVTASTIVFSAAGDIGDITDFATLTGDTLEVSGLAAGGLQAQTGSGVINIGIAGNYTAGNDDIAGAATFILGATGNLDLSAGLAALGTASDAALVAGGTLTLPSTTSMGTGSTLALFGNDIVAAGATRTLDFSIDTLDFHSGGNVTTTLTGDIGTLSGQVADNLVVAVDSALTVDGLTSNGGMVDITVTSGDANIVDVDTSAVDDDSNDISVTAQNGDVIAGSLVAGVQNDIILSASGSIVDAAGTVQGQVLTLDAGVDIGASAAPLTTVAEVIAADAIAGDIWLSEADGVVLGNISGTGSIDVTAGGGIVIAGVISSSGTAADSLDIDARGGGILMTVDAGGTPSGITQTGGAAIDLTAVGDIVITVIDAGTGSVDITSSGGSVIVNPRQTFSPASANITGGSASIAAATGIGSVSGTQLVIDTPTLTLVSGGPVVEPILLQDTILNFTGNLLPPLSQLLGNLSFDPDLEGLAYLDPAIFTAVGNYATDEDALEMPEDQKVADGVPVDDAQPVVKERAPAAQDKEQAQADGKPVPLAMN